MEQNQESDEEFIEKLKKTLKKFEEDNKRQIVSVRQEDSFGEKFHDVYETTDQIIFNSNNNSLTKNNSSDTNISSDKVSELSVQDNLKVENHYLSLQLQAEKKKSKELQTKFKLFENSVKYFERLNNQLETIKRAVDENFADQEKLELSLETMQKLRPKTVHTAASGTIANSSQSGAKNFCEQPPENKITTSDDAEEKDDVSFRNADDFKLLEEELEIVKDKKNECGSEIEKVFITKTEKRCLEDIGNLAARTRTPISDKHQKYFEKDRRKFAHSIAMPDIQEVDKGETVPLAIMSKTNETPVNITSTELDGLRSYLLQLKELIARRETAWARTTERDYNQRVEITRFKNEVARLRMLCDKRQRDIKERDQIIASKDDEIKELQKRVQGLRNAVMKLEKKDEKLIDTLDGMTNEVLENSHIVQRSYNAMKRHSLMNRTNGSSSLNIPYGKPPSKSKDSIHKTIKIASEKTSYKKGRSLEMARPEEEDWKVSSDKNRQKTMVRDKAKPKNKGEILMNKTKETYEKVDEKLQKVEEMLHNEVLKEARKMHYIGKTGKHDSKSHSKNSTTETSVSSKRLTPSNSTIRQEMLTALTGLNPNASLVRSSGIPDGKKNHGTASMIANALLAARNPTLFNY